MFGDSNAEWGSRKRRRKIIAVTLDEYHEKLTFTSYTRRRGSAHGLEGVTETVARVCAPPSSLFQQTSSTHQQLPSTQ